jgi:hypothetical protein
MPINATLYEHTTLQNCGSSFTHSHFEGRLLWLGIFCDISKPSQAIATILISITLTASLHTLQVHDSVIILFFNNKLGR